MINYIKDFMSVIKLNEDCRSEILKAYDKAENNITFNWLLDNFYTADIRESLQSELDKIADLISVDCHTVYLMFYVCLSKTLKDKYNEAGISEEIFWDSLDEMRYKSKECFNFNDVWGIISPYWYWNFFHLKLFGFGCLEYILTENTFIDEEVVIAGNKVAPGDMVLFIHIPSTDKPFTLNARLDSYEKAYRFFKERLNGKEPVFLTRTWLINPKNKEFLKSDSNILSFANDFNIVKSFDYKDNKDMHRVYGKYADLPKDKLPRNTSLQKSLAEWLMKGNTLGAGVGLFMFDPINKTTIK